MRSLDDIEEVVADDDTNDDKDDEEEDQEDTGFCARSVGGRYDDDKCPADEEEAFAGVETKAFDDADVTGEFEEAEG